MCEAASTAQLVFQLMLGKLAGLKVLEASLQARGRWCCFSNPHPRIGWKFVASLLLPGVVSNLRGEAAGECLFHLCLAPFHPVSLLGLVKPGVFCRLLGSSRHYLK